MSYPNYKNKHLEKALFNPVDYIRYNNFPRNFPKKYILTYQTYALNFIKRKYNPKKIKLHNLLTIYVHKNVGFVKMTGMGCPHAVAILEELIALGGKQFINIGTAGGLHHEGIFLCDKALRDEGTSHHYIPFGKYSYPNRKLTDRMRMQFIKDKIKFFEGATWTIDAPYRETKAEVEKYAKQGIKTVEMEASALFAVARYRKIELASAFVVSDLLGKKWLPKFHRFDVKREHRKLISCAFEVLR